MGVRRSLATPLERRRRVGRCGGLIRLVLRPAGLAAVLALAMLLSGSASATPPWLTDLTLINKGIDRAVALNRIDGTEAAEYRGDANAAADVLPKLPSSRYRNLAAVAHQVAGFWKGYDSPRGRTLFAMLAFNTRWFASHWDQKPGKDVFDSSDGIWYRAFPGIGFQFHPLENFGKLNNFVAQKNTTRAEQLAQSLLDRSVVRAGGLAWEYYFRFEGGQPPWISGMAQAVAAQALSGAGTLLADPPLDYHQYVVGLLGILSRRTQDPTLTTYAQRFGDDLRQPPVVNEGPAPGAIYPWPQDGYRDYARYVFWVSKRSTVRLQIDHAGSPVVVSRGWHTILWSPGPIQPGQYTPNLHASDVVGNASDTDLPPVEVRRDTQAPKINASLAARRLYWRGTDDASPWMGLKVVIRRPGAVRTLWLGKQTFRGSALLAAPRGVWSATLFAADSSGNTAKVPLGSLRVTRP